MLVLSCLDWFFCAFCQKTKQSRGLASFIGLPSHLPDVPSRGKFPAFTWSCTLPEHCELKKVVVKLIITATVVSSHWLIWHDFYHFSILSCYADISFIFYLMIEGLTVITLFILLRLCVCHVNCLFLCDYLTIWGWYVWWADALPTRNFGSPSWPSEERKKNKDA